MIIYFANKCDAQRVQRHSNERCKSAVVQQSVSHGKP